MKLMLSYWFCLKKQNEPIIPPKFDKVPPIYWCMQNLMFNINGLILLFIFKVQHISHVLILAIFAWVINHDNYGDCCCLIVNFFLMINHCPTNISGLLCLLHWWNDLAECNELKGSLPNLLAEPTWNFVVSYILTLLAFLFNGYTGKMNLMGLAPGTNKTMHHAHCSCYILNSIMYLGNLFLPT